jgi:transposase InsO family protein
VEQLSELETEHQYIQGHLNAVADAASRYPLLGPKRLAPRGLAHSVQEVLSRLPEDFKSSLKINVHAGTYTADLKLIVQSWIFGNKGNVQAVAPTKKGYPAEADLSIMIPRPEDSPVTLALYLMSTLPFAVLVPNDLLSESFADKIYPEANAAAIKLRFQAAGKLQILVTQMTWVVGNIPQYTAIEMFTQTLRTTAPITGSASQDPPNQSSDLNDTFDEPVPTLVEEWITEQTKDAAFLQSLEALHDIACRDGLYLYAPDNMPPRILVPPGTREPLIRFTHARMFHLGQAKVAERLLKSYFWPTLRKDTRKYLADCPECELEKGRQNQAHGLFRARPHDAPRTRFAMDFQGQGTATTGETEALGIIDTTARFVTVIALPNRTVQTFVQPFLDQIVFRHGPPETLHCDEAPEFMSELLKALADITETTLTTTLAHNARSNGIIEIFWRYWNRCMKLLPDDQYHQWPRFVSQIVFAYNTAPHASLGGISPYEVYYGVPARDTFSKVLTIQTEDLPQLPDEAGDKESARLFALAVKTSTTAFVQLARNHDQYVKNETATLLNQQGFPRAFVIGAKVKARFPPTKAEMDATGRRSNHISSWRGPCRITDRLSTTTYKLLQLDNNREYERSISNLLPWKAESRKKARNAQYVETISTPFQVNDFIAVRDEPGSWYYLARVTSVTTSSIIVHYYGTRSPNLQLASFYPGWHLSTQNTIRLALEQPEHFIRYSGVLELKAMNNLLVARNLALTSTHRLTSKSRRLLMPVRDELFIFQ